MRRRAFTLIELIVVMGIIVCLMTILLPVLSRLRESGRRVQCLSNLKSLTVAWIAYAADNEQRLCTGGWTGPLSKYLQSAAPYRCPDDLKRIDIVPYSYAINGVVTGALLPGTYSRLDDIRSPTSVFVFIEACPPPRPKIRAGPAPEVFVTPVSPQFYLQPGGWPGQNHRGVKASAEGTAISFADGHAIFWDYTDSRLGNLEEASYEQMGPLDGTGYTKAAAPNSPDVYQLEIWSGGPAAPDYKSFQGGAR